MEEKFYSKENFLVLKEIISKITGNQINSNELYSNMVNCFDNFNNFTNNMEDDFHSINKNVVNSYSSELKEIPQKPLQNDANIYDPIDNNFEEKIEETNVNDLFNKLKNDRDNNISLDNDYNENVDESSDDNIIKNDSIVDNIEERILKGQDLNENFIFPHHNNEINNLKDDLDNLSNDLTYLDNDRNNEIIKNNNYENEYDEEESNNIQDSNNEHINLNSNNLINNQNYLDDNDNELNNNDITSTLKPYTMYPSIQKINQVEKEIIITIDSKDRDLSIYPHPTNFQVKFGAITDTIEIPTRLGENGVVIHDPATLYKGYQGAIITKVLKNIKTIKLINATIPYVSYFYNGSFPTNFNNENQTDGNSTGSETWRNISNDLGYLYNAYRPLFEKSVITGTLDFKTGIPKDVLNEPYLLLNIDELDNQNNNFSTNLENTKSFARLINDKLIASQLSTNFAIFTTYSEHEGMVFNPTLLSSLDKMTLHLKDMDNNYIKVGQDKTYVNIIDENINGHIINKDVSINPSVNGGTKITIKTKHNDYKYNNSLNDEIEGHCLSPGDIIYFYTTKPCNNEHIYNLNSQLVSMSIDSDDNITILLKTNNNDSKIIERELRISQYLFIGDYISLDNQLYRILSFDGKKAKLENPPSTTFTTNNIGFVKQNKRGFNSDNVSSLYYKGGHLVCYINDNNTFTIDLEYDECNNYDDTSNNSDTIFFIKKNLQTSFMFKFTIVEKDYEEVKSELL